MKLRLILICLCCVFILKSQESYNVDSVKNHLYALENSNQDIRTALLISKRTVETHKKNTFLKLGVKNNIGLAKIVNNLKNIIELDQ